MAVSLARVDSSTRPIRASGTGRCSRNPCAKSTPINASRAITASFSTPSATVFMPMITDTEAEAEKFAAMMGGMFGLDAAQVKRMPMALIGTPAECVVELKRREQAWGVRHYIMSGFGGPALSERFAREVAPKV